MIEDDEDDIEVIDETDAPVGAAASSRGKMDDEKWAKVRYLAEYEGKRGSELAREFGVSPSLVSRHFSDHGVVVGSKKKVVEEKAEEAAAERMARTLSDFAVQRKQRILQTKIQHFGWSARLAQEAMALIDLAKKDGKPFGFYDKDVKALRGIAAIIEKMRSERMITLDAVNEIDETALPVFEFHDLSDEDIAEIQRSQVDGDPTEDGERSEVVEAS